MSRKFLVAVALVAMTVASVARAVSEQNAVLEFSTPGPDFYADGTPVMKGEIYALVWIRSGAVFSGVLNDGTLADPDNCELVIAQPNAGSREVDGVTVGYCRPTLFHVPAEFIAAHQDGSYVVALLDTRVKEGASGGLVPSGNAQNVLGWCEVASYSSALVAGGASSLPQSVEPPTGGVQTLAAALAAPAEFSGSVTITEWTRLPGGNWKLSIEADNTSLKRGALASITPGQTFTVRYATTLEELVQDGETETSGYLDFDIEERSLNADRMKMKILTEAPKTKDSKSLFMRIVSPKR